MSDFDEEEVDPELISNIKKPIEKKKRTYTELHEEETVSEEDEEEEQPVTKKTKDQIYHLWSQNWEQKGTELLPIVQKLSTMSEEEAKAYLAVLQAVHSKNAHKHITDKILYFVSTIVCHPKDALTPLAMQEDEYLKSGTSLMVSDFLTFLGRMGYLALLVAYGGTSRYLYQEAKSKTVTPPGVATETVQDDGVRARGDGEDNPHDKVND